MPYVTSSDGTRLAYETTGSGPIVVLVDGAMCFRDSGPMRPLAAALAGDATVVFYDRRGRGESGDTPPSSVDREVDDLEAVISAVGGPATLVGMSSGGGLVLAAADRLGPGTVERIAVYEPPYLPHGMLPTAAAYSAELTAALADGRHDDAVVAFFTRVGVPAPAIDGMRRSPGWADTVALAPTLAYDDAAMGDSSIPDETAARITVPALTIAGGASPDFLRYGAEQLAAALPHARYEELDGQGHDVDTAALAGRLATFVNAQR